MKMLDFPGYPQSVSSICDCLGWNMLDNDLISFLLEYNLHTIVCPCFDRYQ